MQAAQSRGVSAIHVILVILMLATLGGVGYLGWQMQGQSAADDQSAATEDDLAALRTELAESQRMLAEKSGETLAPTVATNEHTLYEDRTYGFRIVTRPACSNVFQVRSDAATQNFLTAVAVYLPQATDWPRDYSWISYAVMTPQAYQQTSKDVVSQGIVELFRTGPPGYYSFVEFQPQDVPSEADLRGSDGTTCRFVVQPLP